MNETTKEDVAVLLQNFEDYVNPDGDLDPWFTIEEINQQFAWDDVDDQTLDEWLTELEEEGLATSEIQQNVRVWRWLV
jgi:hypothetical protein